MRLLGAVCLLAVLTAAVKLERPLFKALREAPVSVDGALSRGVAWGDLDGDGLPELAVANTINQLDFLYNNAGGGTFVQRHETPLTLHGGYSEGIAFVDIDNDGDLDALVSGTTGNVLYRNDGSGALAAVEASGLGGSGPGSSPACWGDYNNDGYLDVFIPNRNEADDQLFRNERGERFVQVEAGPWVGRGGDARTCAFGDADSDGDLDLYVGNFIERDTDGNYHKQKNFFYRNDGDGTFTAIIDHPLVSTRAQTYGLSWVDFDYDGDLDLFMTNIGLTDRNQLFENRGNLEFVLREDLAVVSQSRGPSKGHAWGDFDNDGDLDLFVANGTEGTEDIDNYGIENFLYLNDGNGRFVRVTGELITDDTNISAGAAWADFDSDGDLDIYVANWGGSDEDNILYRNESDGNHWLKVALAGGASNRAGIGAIATIVYVENGSEKRQTRALLPQTGYGSMNEPILHFGLGQAQTIKSLEIKWPSGENSRFENLSANAFLLIREDEPVPILLKTELSE